MKYAKYQRQKTEHTKVIHPIWRGIGCLLWIIVPLLSYALASLFVDYASRKGILPAGLLGYIQFPDWVLKARVLSVIAGFIGSLKNLWAMLLFFLISLIVLIGIFTTLYAIAYRFIGPPRYTVVDAPPGKYRPTKQIH